MATMSGLVESVLMCFFGSMIFSLGCAFCLYVRGPPASARSADSLRFAAPREL